MLSEEACARTVPGVPSISILSRDPSFRKPSNTWGKQPVFQKRTMVEKNGESTPRTVLLGPCAKKAKARRNRACETFRCDCVDLQ